MTELQGNRVVTVVDKRNKTGMRPVKMGERFGAMWEVVEGLKAGDKVIVQGMQKTPPGSTVQSKSGPTGSRSCFGCLSRQKGTLSHVASL